MIALIKKFYLLIIRFGKYLQPVLLLAMRLFWGWQFFIGGWHKLHKIASIGDYFATLGIPWPLLNAYLVSSIEFVGGFLLLIGLASRLASIPLSIIMVVALLTAHPIPFAELLNDPQKLVDQAPFNFLLTSLIVLAFGPGAFSIDALLKKKSKLGLPE